MYTDWTAIRLLNQEILRLDDTKQRAAALKSWRCTCVCFCSSFSCGSHGGCLMRRRRRPSEVLGPEALSPHPPCPPGWVRFLGSEGRERRHFPYRCLPHLNKSKARCKTKGYKVRLGRKCSEIWESCAKTTHAFHSCGPVSHRAHTPPKDRNFISAPVLLCSKYDQQLN